MNVYTASQAAERIGVSVAQVRRLIKAGRIPAVDIVCSERKAKPRYRITDDALRRFIDAQSMSTSEPTPQQPRRRRIDANVPQVY